MNNTITVKQKIYVHAGKIHVWDYTQDFEQRALWDQAIEKCAVLQRRPFKRVKVHFIGRMAAELEYKLCRKYEKTSLQMTNMTSFIFKGGGGSWQYKSEDAGTIWMQTNSLVIKNRFLFLVFGRIAKFQLSLLTNRSMKKAKYLLENKYRLPSHQP